MLKNRILRLNVIEEGLLKKKGNIEIDIIDMITQSLKESKKSLSPVEIFNLLILKDLIPPETMANMEIQHIRSTCNDLAKEGILIEKESGKFIHYENFKESKKIITGSREFDIKKEIFLPMLAIAAGEILMFFGMMYYGLAIHIINLQAVTLAPIFKNFSSEIKMIHQSLILLLLLRIVNLAMPQFFTMTLLWYPLTYGIMYIAVYSVIRNQQISYKELGFIFTRLHIYLPAAILIGAVSAVIEYRILKPSPLIDSIGLSNLVMVAVVMFIFIGAIEELIFRSILLTRLEKVLEPGKALLISGILFGIMHSGYGRIDEILYTVIFGIVIGYIFQKTRSLPFIMVIHGTANLLLFGILPIILP